MAGTRGGGRSGGGRGAPGGAGPQQREEGRGARPKQGGDARGAGPKGGKDARDAGPKATKGAGGARLKQGGDTRGARPARAGAGPKPAARSAAPSRGDGPGRPRPAGARPPVRAPRPAPILDEDDVADALPAASPQAGGPGRWLRVEALAPDDGRAPAPPPPARPAAPRKARPSPWPAPSALPPGEVALVGVHTDDLPAPWGIEVAIAGRSNVGKSSAINRLLKRNGLARTSSTPGRTQTLNFFAVGGAGVLVDLPGYGFARVPEAVKARWAGFIEGYLYERENLRLVVCLVDGSIPPQRIDTELVEALIEAEVPLLVAATKLDRISRTKRPAALAALAAAHGVPAVLGLSAVEGFGFDELRQIVDEVWADAEG